MPTGRSRQTLDPSCSHVLITWMNGCISNEFPFFFFCHLPFAVPMVWREPKDHMNDCDFCLCNIKGYLVEKRGRIKYPNLSSAIRPVLHSDELPVPNPPVTQEHNEESVESEAGSQADSEYDDPKSTKPQLFSQEDLHDLIRDLEKKSWTSWIAAETTKFTAAWCADDYCKLQTQGTVVIL